MTPLDSGMRERARELAAKVNKTEPIAVYKLLVAFAAAERLDALRGLRQRMTYEAYYEEVVDYCDERIAVLERLAGRKT